jgi:glutamate-1-semialdehyde 2,1-aminomutase
MFTEHAAIRDYREFCQHVDRKAYQQFVFKLFEFGIYTTPSATLHSIVTLAHNDKDVDFTLVAAEKALGASANLPASQ